MKDILLVIDMQNDFVFGPLSTNQAREIVQNVKEKVLNFKGDIYFTRILTLKITSLARKEKNFLLPTV